MPEAESRARAPGRRSELSQRRTAMEEILEDAMRQWRQDGDLARLSGKPLDLTDDSPEWFSNRLLKGEGFSHPTIERGRNVDQLLREAELIEQKASEVAQGLAGVPERLLGEYRAKLEEYNRAVVGYNISVPELLQRSLVNVEDWVKQFRQRLA